MERSTKSSTRLKNNIRKFREELGISQEKLAWRAGISISYISRVELGKSIPSIQNALLIAEALEVDVTEVFFLCDDTNIK